MDGYSQPNRWTGYNAIINNGRKVAGAKGDFDCSSLIIACYILAGLSIAASGYNGNLKSILVGTGKFKASPLFTPPMDPCVVLLPDLTFIFVRAVAVPIPFPTYVLLPAAGFVP